LPDDDDFTNLEAAIKAEGAKAWADWNSGFALAGYGLNGSYGDFEDLYGLWWSSSSSNRIWYVGIEPGGNLDTDNGSASHSVRCRKTQVGAVAGVALDKPTLALTVGGTDTLKATVAPDNATNKAVTWGSSAPTVATVSGGVVTAVAAGTATITVTTTDGGKTATCAVTVSAESSSGITDGDSVTDADGNTYRTKVYNGVEWMIDNSKKTTGVTDCTYDPIDRVDYGSLYSWSCAASACPEGYQLPGDDDFTNLEAALNAEGAAAWADWNSGYALAGYGADGSYGNFEDSYGLWWSSGSSNMGWYVSSGGTGGTGGADNSNASRSVRCRKSD
jgi:uncharacterized protein (TIGR02145 family)